MEPRVETKNPARQVDLHSSVAILLRKFVGDRKRGFLFASRSGKPISLTKVLRRRLHPVLKDLG